MEEIHFDIGQEICERIGTSGEIQSGPRRKFRADEYSHKAGREGRKPPHDERFSTGPGVTRGGKSTFRGAEELPTSSAVGGMTRGTGTGLERYVETK